MHIFKLGRHTSDSLIVLRIAFLALVTLNMTIVCQGHMEGNLRVGAHLIVLKDPPFIVQAGIPLLSSQQQAQPVPAFTSSTPKQIPAAFPLHVPSAASKQPCTVQPLSAPLATGGANVLGMVFSLTLPTGVQFTRLSGDFSSVRTSHVAPGPDAPPPRTLLPTLS